jgi:hypothetical protein
MNKISCKYCGRYLGEVKTLVGELLCSNSNCKATTQFKIISNTDTANITYKFTTPEKQPKHKEQKHD